MRVNVKEFLEESGITEAFYPGKRLVHACRQAGQYKSHCVVFDWRDPDKIRVEIKAGLSGKSLDKKDLKYYPVSFQAPTYVDIEIVNDNEEEDEEGRASGSSGGGGKQPKKSLNDLKSMAFEAFGEALVDKIPELGKIVEMMVMGKEIAADAYGNVMATLSDQIQNAKVSATDLAAQAGKLISKVMPPSFLKAKGNENVKYTYNREKNADIGFQKSGP